MAAPTEPTMACIYLSDDSSGLSSPLSSVPSSPLSPPTYLSLKRSSDFPTPPSSQQTSQSGSPDPYGMDAKDGAPAAKRRRISKDNTTQYLDLSQEKISEEQQPVLDRLLRVLHKRKKIVVVAGAGISASAGIPVFRSDTGIFKSVKAEHKLKGSGKDLFDASVYSDPLSTESFHSMVHDMSQLSKGAKATPFHHMLASLAQDGRLLRLYSQNVDGIEVGLEPLQTTVPLRKKNDEWPKTVQLHGGLEKMVCMKCHQVSDLDAKLFQGPIPPACKTCRETDDVRVVAGKRSHGIGRLRPRMVLYSERNPDEEAIGKIVKQDLRRRPDAVIVVGTTLKVPGVCRIVREMCATARDHRDGLTIWINNDPPPLATQFKDCFDLVVTGTADAVASHTSLSHYIPAKLKYKPLPSAEHNNDSFRPPSAGSTPGPEEPTPPICSPDKRASILPVETSFDGENITVQPFQQPTPTKSVKGSPAKNFMFIPRSQKAVQGVKSSGGKKPTKPRKKASASKKSHQSQQPGLVLNTALRASKPSTYLPNKDKYDDENEVPPGGLGNSAKSKWNVFPVAAHALHTGEQRTIDR